MKYFLIFLLSGFIISSLLSGIIQLYFGWHYYSRTGVRKYLLNLPFFLAPQETMLPNEKKAAKVGRYLFIAVFCFFLIMMLLLQIFSHAPKAGS